MNGLEQLSTSPIAHKNNIILGETYRITVLTECLLRLEYSEEGIFEDRATQTVLNRDFDKVSYLVMEKENELLIQTAKLKLTYNKKKFSRNGLQVKYTKHTSGFGAVWNYGEETNDLKGTARTLDGVDGACELEMGLLSYFGISILDDHKMLTFTSEGWLEPRRKGIEDFYVFGYGHDYKRCLKDFYYLCGKQPMLPRYALGNWWSRYYQYNEESYKQLVLRFNQEGIPLAVAVLDMDWHLVEIPSEYGSGWTGYTWNRELFPDPAAFLQWLHNKGMRVTLNDHPADGIRRFEESYDKIADIMHVDTTKKEPVECDITDPNFVKAWFEHVLHPLEEQGVDFWWIDWQQGNSSKLEGLDPLWMHNHLRFLDSRRSGKRPMILSRYAGVGSHRYPVGFSGDTIITWDSLKFQPFFTSNASNIGFGWWSHDIGGHMKGIKDDELAGRWLQLGVFSPICRLHSSNSIFHGKEPWRYRTEIHQMMIQFLRLRHQLLPYLYTMNYLCYQYDEPLIQPMYYRNPEAPEAYQFPNQYYFGKDMIVAPITEKCIEHINRAKVSVWLPDGTYKDFFTGTTYEGNQEITMYRGINSIPVLVPVGGIIPMTNEIDSSDNPHSLFLKVFVGKDGSFELYEDDNETCRYEEGNCAITEFQFQWSGVQSFRIMKVKGDTSLVPAFRSYHIEFVGCCYCNAYCKMDGQNIDIITNKTNQGFNIVLTKIPCTSDILISFEEELILQEESFEEQIRSFLDQAECEYELKEKIYQLARKNKKGIHFIQALQSYDMDKDMLGCIIEIAALLD